MKCIKRRKKKDVYEDDCDDECSDANNEGLKEHQQLSRNCLNEWSLRTRMRKRVVPLMLCHGRLSHTPNRNHRAENNGGR